MKTRLSQVELNKSYHRLKEKAAFDVDFIVLSISSTIICALGLSLNSLTVVIGSMLISPLLYPLLETAVSAVNFEASKFFKNLFFLILGFCMILLISYLTAIIIDIQVNELFISITDNTEYLPYFLIAFFSGLAGTFSFFWPGIIEAITGIAISIAILPPICMLGIVLANKNGDLESVIKIITFNYSGIFLGSLIVLIIFKILNQRRFVKP